jgi:hypothetical protein
MLWIVLSAGVTGWLASSASRASFPTLSGPTGLVNTPTADVVRAGRSQAAILYDHRENGAEVDLLPALHYLRGGPRSEIGVGWMRFDESGPGESENGFVLHGKVRLLDPTALTPALSVGAVFSDVSDVGSSQTLYAAVSQSLTRPPVVGGTVYGHLTLGLERFDPDGGDSDSDLFGGIGLEYRNPLRLGEWSAFLDYQFENDLNGDDQLSLGARMQLVPGWTGQIGVGDDSEFFLGVTYTK